MDTQVEPGDQFSSTLVTTSSLVSRDLATLVDQHFAAQWRGDEDADHPFFRWLASCWQAESESEPRSAPPAISVLAAGGLGIRWFETPSAILGFVPGRPEGYYRVPKAAQPPRVGPRRPEASMQRQPRTTAGRSVRI